MPILPLCLTTTTYKQLIKSVGFIGENPLLKDVVSAITLCTGQEVDGWQEDITTLAQEMAHAQDRIHGTRYS